MPKLAATLAAMTSIARLMGWECFLLHRNLCGPRDAVVFPLAFDGATHGAAI